MMKLREETVEGKKGRGEFSDARKPVMQKELEILCELLMKDKSNIPACLKTLDEGNLKFPRTELLSFLKSVDNEVREFATDSNLKKYPSKFLALLNILLTYSWLYCIHVKVPIFKTKFCPSSILDKFAWRICHHYDGTTVIVHMTINQSTEAIRLPINSN